MHYSVFIYFYLFLLCSTIYAALLYWFPTLENVQKAKQKVSNDDLNEY